MVRLEFVLSLRLAVRTGNWEDDSEVSRVDATGLAAYR
jgi:hypothetical protein